MLRLRPVPDDARPGWIDTLADRQDALRFRKQYDDPEASAERAAEFVAEAVRASRVFEVVDDGANVGHLWWGRDGDAGAILDVRLDDPHRVGELLPHVLELAREDGVSRVALAGVPTDPTRTAMVGLPGFVPRATNMRLLLDDLVTTSSDLELRPMSQEEFDEFHGRMGIDYADELAAAGLTPETALRRSREQMAELIPDGLASPGQEFFSACVGEQRVGHLWLSTERPMAFVYDIAVREDQRRKGYGAAIMDAGAVWCREQGHFALGLNVFAHNPGARALYDKLGYVVTVDYRTLDLADAD